MHLTHHFTHFNDILNRSIPPETVEEMQFHAYWFITNPKLLAAITGHSHTWQAAVLLKSDEEDFHQQDVQCTSNVTVRQQYNVQGVFKKRPNFCYKDSILQHFKHCPLQSSPLYWWYKVPNVSSIVRMLPGTHFLWWRAVLLSHFPESSRVQKKPELFKLLYQPA